MFIKFLKVLSVSTKKLDVDIVLQASSQILSLPVSFSGKLSCFVQGFCSYIFLLDPNLFWSVQEEVWRSIIWRVFYAIFRKFPHHIRNDHLPTWRISHQEAHRHWKASPHRTKINSPIFTPNTPGDSSCRMQLISLLRYLLRCSNFWWVCKKTDWYEPLILISPFQNLD